MNSRTIDLRDFQRDERGLVAVGQGRTDGDRAATPLKPALEPMSFAVDVKAEIMQFMAGGGLQTRASIAKAIKRRKTTWLNKHIEDLVEYGLIVKQLGAYKNGLPIFLYSFAGTGGSLN